MKRVDLGITRLTWVPGGVENPNAPTIAELTHEDTVDLSCIMATTYEVRADTSDTVAEKAVCDTENVDTPTAGNYMGNFVLFREWDDEEDDWDADVDPLAVFPTAGLFGDFIRRTGLPYDDAYVADQKVELYRFTTDNPQLAGGTDQGRVKLTVPLHKQGTMRLSATVTGT